MKNKFEGLKKDDLVEDNKEKKKEVKLKSAMYNNDAEKIEKREEPKDAVMWGFVLGFALFFILLILILVFTN